MHVQYIHHIDYVVNDLHAAIAHYQRLFGVAFKEVEELESRGVKVARFRLGPTWVALVQPVTAGSPVQSYLAQHGEGFFHIAYAVPDLRLAVRDLKTSGVRLRDKVGRRGLEGWRLVDIDSSETFGVATQLVQTE